MSVAGGDKSGMRATTVASSPGKVLMAGGYVVLETPNRGYVLATSARFHTSVQSSEEMCAAGKASVLSIHSPQYRQNIELEATPVEGSDDVKVTHVKGAKNPYVVQTVAVAITAAKALRRRWERAEDLERLLLGTETPKDVSAEVLRETLAFHFRFPENLVATIGADKTQLDSSSKDIQDVTALRLLAAGRALGASAQRLAALLPSMPAFEKLEEVVFEGDEDAVRKMSPGASVLSKKSGQDNFPEPAGLPARIEITLQADNDFYSQQTHLEARGLPYNTTSLATLEPYMPCINEAGDVEVSKTGLGSSAAMVSSLVSAIVMDLFVAFHDKEAINLDTLHAVAQLAHGVIQGKIGSGFDVCAALYGSMRYVRYDPKGLEEPLTRLSEASADAPVSAEAILLSLSRLDHETTPFELPPRLQLMCGDVRGGSETPSMSRNVLKWRKSAPAEEIAHWDKLITSNEAVAANVAALHKLATEDKVAYDAMLDEFAASGTAAPALQSLRDAFSDVRACLRKVGELADVPIEPPSQSKLCDATEAQAGVVMCGVPGAGGFDAVFAVVVDSSREKVEKFWETSPGDQKISLMTPADVCVTKDMDKLLCVRGFSVGISDCIADSHEPINFDALDDYLWSDLIQRKGKWTERDKAELCDALAELTKLAPPEAQQQDLYARAGEDNRLLDMIQSGSKGSISNYNQITRVVGQQIEEAGRVSKRFTPGTRTLPHFSQHDRSAAAGGLVKSSFIKGLSPHEMFFHAMGGRIGIIDTACETFVTGGRAV
ncbi:DNA-directed RNA polymerase subunit [Hondaea fermentalgiana]|uniref:DNA-directed RNA polymerase subunit n=1 Tax=Hondaea fermentalgiana TaxID=2315210 RepID=A0A2R5H054_9STRA|nr:DNA-directed RNA polymerase subunit [Hondaea fermentalgiana]|eukprot:GBG34121.1 DNA-directed RNA polymerase subunit [Hondaea fermentalgiana]